MFEFSTALVSAVQHYICNTQDLHTHKHTYTFVHTHTHEQTQTVYERDAFFLV